MIAAGRKVKMNSNNPNNSRGCAGWVKGLGGGLLALLTAAASCAGILQYFDSARPAPVAPVNPVIVITSEPASNAQANVSNISPEQWQAVEDFLRNAVNAEVTAYQYGDPSYANMFYGDALQSIQNQISDLNSKGILMDAHFDYDKSYIRNIRVPQTNRIEADSCEYWANNYYDRQTGSLISSDTWTLVPQTIVIENLNNNFFITSVAFYTGQAFCS